MSRISQSDNIDHAHDHEIYFPNRVIFLTGDVDVDMYHALIKNLSILERSTGTIELKMFSEGGCVQSGWAIHDAIRECKNYVRIIGYGEISSMASIIMQAADERVLMPNACMMVHIGSKSLKGHVENFERWNNYFNKVEKVKSHKLLLSKIKEKKKRFTNEKLDKLLQFDTILTPDQALEIGLIDKIGEIR